MLVDTHCHVSPIWYEPVELLLSQMAQSDVSQAILIQLIDQSDNRYQQECIQRYPDRFASVVWIDPNGAGALDELRRCVDQGASGVRLRPGARSPGADPLAIWRCAEAAGIVVSCVGNITAFLSAEFTRLITECPNLALVLEHLGDTSQPPADDVAHAQRLRVAELARYENVYLKIPGLGELTKRRLPLPPTGSPFPPGVPAVLQAAVEAFGSCRLMWGSDFPLVSSREGYGQSLLLLRQALGHLPQVDIENIFGGVARRLFHLPALA
jgi:L-fuconolactonase